MSGRPDKKRSASTCTRWLRFSTVMRVGHEENSEEAKAAEPEEHCGEYTPNTEPARLLSVSSVRAFRLPPLRDHLPTRRYCRRRGCQEFARGVARYGLADASGDLSRWLRLSGAPAQVIASPPAPPLPEVTTPTAASAITTIQLRLRADTSHPLLLLSDRIVVRSQDLLVPTAVEGC